MLAYGFTNALLDGLERDGLVTLQPGMAHLGGNHRQRPGGCRYSKRGALVIGTSLIGRLPVRVNKDMVGMPLAR
jgi:hypothetical protein